MPFSKPKYQRDLMRNSRAWAKGAEAVMRLPPEERFNAAQDLCWRVWHDQIVKESKYKTLFVELLGRIRTAPDAVPFFDEYFNARR